MYPVTLISHSYYSVVYYVFKYVTNIMFCFVGVNFNFVNVSDCEIVEIVHLCITSLWPDLEFISYVSADYMVLKNKWK